MLSRYVPALVLLMLAVHLISAFAALPVIDPEVRDVTAQDFRMLAANSAHQPQDGRRALLQSTAFSQDLFNILEPILIGDTGQ